MSWYEEAADEISEWTQKTGHSLRSEIAAIISKHDQNRWIPVKEAPPKGNIFDDAEFYDPLCQRPQRMTVGMYTKARDARIEWALRITHWRPINPPEVKGA